MSEATYKATCYFTYKGEEGYSKKVIRELWAESIEDFKDTIIKETPPGWLVEFGPISRVKGTGAI